MTNYTPLENYNVYIDLVNRLARIDDMFGFRAAESGVLEEAGYTPQRADTVRRDSAFVRRDQYEKTRTMLRLHLSGIIKMYTSDVPPLSYGMWQDDSQLAEAVLDATRFRRCGFYDASVMVLFGCMLKRRIIDIDLFHRIYETALAANRFDYALFILNFGQNLLDWCGVIEEDLSPLHTFRERAQELFGWAREALLLTQGLEAGESRGAFEKRMRERIEGLLDSPYSADGPHYTWLVDFDEVLSELVDLYMGRNQIMRNLLNLEPVHSDVVDGTEVARIDRRSFVWSDQETVHAAQKAARELASGCGKNEEKSWALEIDLFGGLPFDRFNQLRAKYNELVKEPELSGLGSYEKQVKTLVCSVNEIIRQQWEREVKTDFTPYEDYNADVAIMDRLSSTNELLGCRAMEPGVLEGVGFIPQEADKFRSYFASALLDQYEQTHYALWHNLRLLEDMYISKGTPIAYGAWRDDPLMAAAAESAASFTFSGFYDASVNVHFGCMLKRQVIDIELFHRVYRAAVAAGWFDYALFILNLGQNLLDRCGESETNLPANLTFRGRAQELFGWAREALLLTQGFGAGESRAAFEERLKERIAELAENPHYTWLVDFDKILDKLAYTYMSRDMILRNLPNMEFPHETDEMKNGRPVLRWGSNRCTLVWTEQEIRQAAQEAASTASSDLWNASWAEDKAPVINPFEGLRFDQLDMLRTKYGELIKEAELSGNENYVRQLQSLLRLSAEEIHRQFFE